MVTSPSFPSPPLFHIPGTDPGLQRSRNVREHRQQDIRGKTSDTERMVSSYEDTYKDNMEGKQKTTDHKTHLVILKVIPEALLTIFIFFNLHQQNHHFLTDVVCLLLPNQLVVMSCISSDPCLVCTIVDGAVLLNVVRNLSVAILEFEWTKLDFWLCSYGRFYGRSFLSNFLPIL